MPDKAVVKYDKAKATTDQLIAAVKKAGFGAKLKTAEKNPADKKI